MSGADELLLFAGDAAGWLRLADGNVVARGAGWQTVPPVEDEEPATVTLVVPGAETAVHWVELPDTLAPAQARGAARLLASEVAAEPLDRLHVALGPVDDGNGERCMALIGRELLERWIADCQSLALDPDRIVPEPLLIAPPEHGLRNFARDGVTNMRGDRRAFAAEADLAALLAGDDTVEALSTAEFEAQLAAALSALPVDLRQGDFAKRRRWTIDWSHVRRLAVIGGALLAVTLAIQLALILRYGFAADALEREAAERAREALPGVVEVADPVGQLRARLVEVGGGPGYSAMAGAIFTAVRETPGAELQSLIFGDDRTVQLAVAAAPTDIAAFQQRLAAAGLSVTPGATRDGGGRQIAEFAVRAP